MGQPARNAPNLRDEDEGPQARRSEVVLGHPVLLALEPDECANQARCGEALERGRVEWRVHAAILLSGSGIPDPDGDTHDGTC